MFGSMETWNSTPASVDETVFEHHNLSVLRQQIFDLSDEIAEREEKYAAKMKLKEDFGDDTGSAIVHGTETTPELLEALKRKLENMQQVEASLVKVETKEVVGKVKDFVRKTAVAAVVALGGTFAKEAIDQKNTSPKTKADIEFSKKSPDA